MNIAILHYSVPSVVGGVESVVAHHARLMAADGHAVRLIAARGESLNEQIPLTIIPLADSRHARVAKMKEQLDRGEVTNDFEALRDELAEQLRAALTGVEILIAHNVCSLNKNLALTAALHQLHTSAPRNFPRLILWHHDLAWTTPRYISELHDGYPWNLLKTAWLNAVQVTVSDMRQSELADLMSINTSMIAVVPNGVDVKEFLKLEEQTQNYVARLELLEASPLLLLPVRITPRKNIELALHVLSYLHKYYPDAQLVVTGPLGPHNPANVAYFDKLRSLRQQLELTASAHFLAELTDGYIPDAVIFDFYRLADLLFLPSWEEGFGIPLLEAGLASMPIFCSDIPPLRKLGGDHAIYFPPSEDPEMVCSLIVENIVGNSVLAMKTNVRFRHTWERVYTAKIAPMLKELETDPASSSFNQNA
ncbi:MAG TPA: glycosyltransferase [Anaerolineales bacterium]|nr:glycosyltransferase [Anaerolineales bacterium]